MTPDELIALADVAEGKWTSGISQSSAKWKLEILAPDLARLCAELGETLGEILRQADLFEMSRNDAEAGLLDIEVVPTMAETATAALAKLAELEAR